MRSNSAALGVFLFAITALHGSLSLSQDSLESIVGTRVYSASRKQEDPQRSPSAVYVITEADIKQMGVRHVADALRTVPGLQVSKISSNKWVVASRGFGEQFSNKLLVMIDGRPVYTALFSGVIWDQQDPPIENIQQIEIIRGPGAALWGSNAVNGVINIITKSSRDTLGTKIAVTTGFTDSGANESILEARNGQKIEGWGTFRSTIKGTKEPSYESVQNTAGFDDRWLGASANFKYDRDARRDSSLSVSGQLFNNTVDQVATFPTIAAPFSRKQKDHDDSMGGYILGNWTKEVRKDAQVSLKGYVDYVNWHYIDVNPRFLNTGMEGQYDFLLFDKWETITGGGLRLSVDDIKNGQTLIYSPTSFTAPFFDTFFQTKVPLIDKELDITLGTKLESNRYVDFALSPNVKLAWYPSNFYTLWGSWSKAQRSPSRGTRSLTTLAASNPAGYVALIPNDEFRSEEADAYETGIRLNVVKGLHIDGVLFYNEYDNLRTFVAGPPQGTNVGAARYLSNTGQSQSKGFELTAEYQTSPVFKLDIGYSYHDLDFTSDPGGKDTVFESGAAKWPNNMFSVRSAYQIRDNVTLNTSVYYSADMDIIGVPSYAKIDSNIAWDVLDNAEITLGIDNVSDPQHPEYSRQLLGEQTEVPRLYYLSFKYEL